MIRTHYGDPCIHCGIAHDDVPVGPCRGDASKAKPIAYTSLGIRWDKVEHLRFRMSDGAIRDAWDHVSMTHDRTRGLRQDESLKRSSATPGVN